MTKILFVCHGNICRSPMAEFILKDMVRKAGREDEFFIASAATSTEEIWGEVGNPIYSPAQNQLRRHKIKGFESKRAVQLKRSDYDKYDLLIGMDDANVRNMIRMCGGDPEGKIRRLLPDRSVSDPWYTDDFDTAFNDIYEGCLALMEEYLPKSDNMK